MILTTAVFVLVATPSFAKAQSLTPDAPIVIRPYPFSPMPDTRLNQSPIGRGPGAPPHFSAGGFSYFPALGWDTPVLQARYNIPTRPYPVRLDERVYATAQISLQVPFGAVVWLQGKKYDGFVGKRIFQSPPLPIGSRFAFEVRVTWVENGELIEQKDRIELMAGERLGILYIALPPDPQSKKPIPKPTGGES